MVANISLGDGPEFIEAARASRRLHRPWIDPPGTPERFAAYLEHTAREDQEAFVIRHASCGGLVGWVSVSNIVRRAFQRPISATARSRVTPTGT
jgi:ribosomal-protein-alanine N-acetyltransferase